MDSSDKSYSVTLLTVPPQFNTAVVCRHERKGDWEGDVICRAPSCASPGICALRKDPDAWGRGDAMGRQPNDLAGD